MTKKSAEDLMLAEYQKFSKEILKKLNGQAKSQVYYGIKPKPGTLPKRFSEIYEGLLQKHSKRRLYVQKCAEQSRNRKLLRDLLRGSKDLCEGQLTETGLEICRRHGIDPNEI